MEGDEDKLLQKSVSSPKVSRPKLPHFAGSGSRSISPRSKTDPGRGEIKAIMEDIMNLKKTDWKTFSRSRTAPLPKGKSLSTNTSPNASPRIGSPVSEESRSLSRDRSRSLKLLTDRLKNKNSKQTVSEESKPSETVVVSRTIELQSPVKPNEQSTALPNVPGSSFEPGGSPRRSPERRSVERTYEQIPESPEDVEQEELEGTKSPLAASSDESFRSAPESVPEDSHVVHEKSPEGDYQRTWEKSPDSDGGESTRSQEDFSKVKELQDKLPEDEGACDSGDHSAPVISTYIYHPIPRNSKFLQLAATKPPKRYPSERRSGIAMLSPRPKMGSVGKAGGEESKSPEPHFPEDQPHQRIQRRSGSGKSSAQLKSPRVVTHPPRCKTPQKDSQCMDTNGFTAGKSSAEMEEEQKQSSHISATESAGEMSDDNFQDVAETIAADSTDVSDRKNGKSTKQKSKSDPSGDRARDNLDFPLNIETPQFRSAPLLSKEDLEALGIDKTLILGDADSKQKSQSEIILSTPSNMGEEVLDYHSSAGEDDEGGSGDFKTSDTTTDCEVAHSTSKFSISPAVSAPVTPHGPSPSPSYTLECPSNLLSVPLTSGPGRKPNIFRSASSASVLQSRKPVGTPLRDKDVVRKYSITSDEAMLNSKSSANLVPDFLPIGDTGNAASMPAVWNKDRLSSTADSPEREPGFIKDKRYHIVEELYKNEKEYVEALRTLKDKYMVPLKTQSSVDDNIVDNIFYMIPEILTHHSIYLDFLDNVWKHWDTSRSTVGNIIITIFAKQTVLESYMSFVENYKASGKVIENALTTKSSVQKFIEQCQKDSGSKLTMKDLIVRPIQRIPRYELLIQRLLDNTPRDHPDSPLLQQACRVMHDLAVKIGTVNDSQHEEDMQETLKKLELLLITDLAVPDRAYIRHDMVQLFNKKDQCCIWLFSDVILISSIKRKSGPVTRKVSIILKTPLGQDFAENIKHKVWLRVGLDDLEIVKTQGTLSRKPTIDREQVEEDFNVVTQLAELAGKLSCQHQGLDDVIKDLSTNLSRQLSEANARNASSDSNKMELLVTSQEGVLHLVIGFSSAEKRATWEIAFTDAKQKLSLLSDKRAPEFLQPLQITKTRAGMQFSCAAPIDGVNSSGFRDVWVCNSDGYVGHMCLLSLQPEPIVTLNTPVPGCNARILCICAVPAFSGAFRRRTSQKGPRGQRDSIVVSTIPEGPRINVEKAVEDIEPPEITLPSETVIPEAPVLVEHSESNDNFNEEGYQSDSDSSDDEPVSFITRTDELYVGELISDDEAPKPKVSELTESSPDPITTSGNWDQDPAKSTMWLGTEDGCIHIFQSCDNIKTTKNKLKIQHGSPVYCIIYLDNKVFVSLVNGDLIVYKRDPEGLWDTECPYTRTIGSAASPITKMLAVAGKLWCGCQNQIHVINPLALNIETSFQVTSDSTKAVQCLVCSGQGVWVASQQSSKVMLFHAVTYEFLLEVSIAQAVSQKLQSADDIIRQHKAACLRITALMVCKDLLWVGTSAGVILTIPIPRITSTTTRGSLATPTVTGLVYGHTGHVRFLTSVEISSTASTKAELAKEGEGAVVERTGGFSFQDIHRRSSMAATTATMASRMLVISGGDGYEDFRNSAANEGAGRDDSTNHLLLWQV
ncbi:rho guanine nucleotide exchange factor 17-like isoform X2 [Physella acuta]|uniref:rho guanine nucleotide exchange factor 17-like isoform X2 n=1 Tax=Physella acuta TaxID=109671 RepID=UPI0027DBBEC0|nr:rho guanine nucleotide exchange factor 17-like isoform X2 [Physella acuta]